MATHTPTTHDRKRKTSSPEASQKLECMKTQKCANHEQSIDEKEYNPETDEDTIFKGFLCHAETKSLDPKGVFADSDEEESNAEEIDDDDDEEKERKRILWVSEYMLPKIRIKIPKKVMESFENYVDMCDEMGECSKLSLKFEDFWRWFKYFLEREYEYKTSNMEKKKKLKEKIEEYYKILSGRFDEEKKCGELGRLFESFDELNDGGVDDIEYSEMNLLEWFNDGEYTNVEEKDVIRFFENLPKVKKK